MNSDKQNSQNETIYLDLDSILPFGEKLRPLLASTLIQKGYLRSLLIKKGVFLRNSDKDVTIPLISQMLLSPDELEQLLDRQVTKESNKKRITRTIDWDTNLPLIEVVKEFEKSNFYDQLISKRSSNYQLLKEQRFRPLNSNPNELSLNYRIRRSDPTKDWINSSSTHDGQIIISRKGHNIVEINLEYTATETKELNEKISQKFIKFCREANYINQKTDVTKILFSNFTNEERVKFLLSLHDHDPSGELVFEGITSIELKIDNKSILPNDIDWMGEIQNAIFAGKKLHNILILKDSRYHSCIVISSIEAIYRFDTHLASGKCIVEYGFPSKRAGQEREFQFELSISNAKLPSGTNKKALEKLLLDRFNDFKNHKHETLHQSLSE